MSLRLDQAIISFTFDDVPKSAVRTGAAILESFGLTGTFLCGRWTVGKD